MKILAIRGKNLASLAGNFEVDFTKEPLASAGIFAITGSTGSGKSTLLDAMCIALFATSPRINKGNNNSDITDTAKYTIKERDCRNILRKGTGNGYAEVDFKALDGKLYRANWSVRRARDNSNGKIQDADSSLYNLTDNYRIDGGKTETLARISELIGLTYEQFTRAVLLAQGEFATFLKASPKDKAEILEKLTGTDIYSKISARIYERYKQAATETKLLEEKIKDILLLAEDEKTALTTQLKELDSKLQTCEKENKQLNNKQEWIERHNQLADNMRKSYEEYKQAQDNLTAAKERLKQLERIDSVQEIRDTYMSAIDIKNRRVEGNNFLTQGEKETAELNKKYADAQKRVDESIEEQEKINSEWLKIKPKLNEALTIEADCRNTSRKIEELEKEAETIETELRKGVAEAEKLKNKITAEEKEVETIDKWLAEHNEYNTIIPKADVVITDITDIVTSRQQIEKREKLLAQATTLLENDEKRLKEKEKEAEKLEKILPAEIAVLRSRLVEGEPCPVCGSCHHSTTTTADETLKEEQLIKAKKDIRESIELSLKNIEENKASISSHKAYIESLRTSIAGCEARVKTILEPLKKSKIALDEAFAKELEQTAIKWNKNSNRKNDITQFITLDKANLVTFEQRIKEKGVEREKIKITTATTRKELEIFKKRIIELIGEDASPESIEKRYNDAVTKVNGRVTAAIEFRGNISAAREKLLGSIAQTRKILDSLNAQLLTAKEKIEKFLSDREDSLTLQELHALLSIDTAEVTRLRNEADTLRNKVLTAETTHKERTKAMEEHAKAPNRPNDGETLDTLNKAVEALSEEKRVLIDSISDISSKLKIDEENKKTHNRYITDFKEKESILNEWKILNDAFGSAEGDKFKIIAQGYTLDILLRYANIHLLNISQRYKLARTATDSLAIKVIDTDIMNEERSVYSLSGGETFLVSLALALALSSLSSNKMSIESLFIDEGFGALDNETLRTAMEALERLQGQGRKVGVISHLQDIIERIPAKIKVIKEQEGKSRVSVEIS